jgi:hypothetical protein
MLRVKPIPAIQQIGQARLFGIYGQEPVCFGHIIHPRDFRHISRVMRTTVQQHNKGPRGICFPRFGHPELEIA